MLGTELMAYAMHIMSSLLPVRKQVYNIDIRGIRKVYHKIIQNMLKLIFYPIKS